MLTGPKESRERCQEGEKEEQSPEAHQKEEREDCKIKKEIVLQKSHVLLVIVQCINKCGWQIGNFS